MGTREIKPGDLVILNCIGVGRANDYGDIQALRAPYGRVLSLQELTTGYLVQWMNSAGDPLTQQLFWIYSADEVQLALGPSLLEE